MDCGLGESEKVGIQNRRVSTDVASLQRHGGDESGASVFFLFFGHMSPESNVVVENTRGKEERKQINKYFSYD